jgi:hypothetical protein
MHQLYRNYVHPLSRSADDPHFGSVKLNQILYFADFSAYRRLGQPITGADYYKLPEGSAPRQLPPVRDALLQDGSIRFELQQSFISPHYRILAQREPQPGVLTAEECSLIDEVIVALRGKTSREATELARQQTGWRLARDLESIPYSTTWFSSDPLTREEIEVGSAVAAYDETT